MIASVEARAARRQLARIKLLHTIVWAVMAGCIVALPLAALGGHFRVALVLTAIVLVECAVLGLNGGRCPMTDWAARYTQDRAANFDIYLPLWLARHNKLIFGTLFVVSVAVVAWAWMTRG